jgi:hypothetical protein
VSLAVAAGLYWSNLLAYRHALPTETLRALALSALVVSAAAVTLVAIGLDLWLYPLRERSFAGALAILAPAAALSVPLALRPEPVSPPPAVPVRLDAAQPSRRIVVVGIDGLARDATRPPPPVLARLARRGVPRSRRCGPEAPPLWTTDDRALPRPASEREHPAGGLRSDWSRRRRRHRPHRALRPRLAPAGRLDDAGGGRLERADASGCRQSVRVWGTQPPEAIHGFVVSPYFHLLSREPEKASAALHPRDLLNEVAARTVRAEELDPGIVAGLAEAPRTGSPLDDPRLRALAERDLAPDTSYRRAADVLVAAYRPARS